MADSENAGGRGKAPARAGMKKNQTVSVIAPAYQNAESLKVFLRSLRKRCRQERFELIVVDDGSSGKDVKQVCAGHPHARLVRLPRNLGPSASRNAGAKVASGEILLFVDSDSEVTSNIVRLAQESLTDPGYAAVIGAPEPRAANPGLFSNFWALVKSECLPKDSEGGSFYPAIGAIRGSVFRRLGGFKESLRSLEDFEFSDRLKKVGARVRFEKRMTVRFFYPPVLRNLRQSFSRAGKWMILRWGKVSFDRHTTTTRQAAGMVLGAANLPMILGAALGLLSWQAVAFGILLYLAVIWPFLAFCCRHRGWFYFPVAAFLQALVATVVILGVARAVWWRLTNVGSPEIFLAPRDA